MHSDRLAFLDDYRDVWDAENAVPYEPEEQQSGPPLRILPAPDSPRTSAAKVRALLTQTPPSVLIEPLPTPEDIRALVPVEGMTFKSLIAAIKPLADRANDKEFLNTVRSVTRVDKTKKLLFLKKEAPVDLGITIPTSSATAREKKRKRNEDRVYQDEPSPVADDELSPVIKKPRKQIDPSYRPGKSPTSPESPSSPIRKPGRPEKNSPADVAYRPATVESAPTSPSVTGRPPKRLRTEGHEAASPFSPRKKRRTERSPAPSPPAHSPPEQWEMKSSSSSSGPASPKKAVKTTAAAETKKQPTAAKAVTPRSPRPTRQAAKDAKGKIEEVLQTTRGKKSDHKTSAKAKPAVKKATKAPAKKTAKAPAKKAPKQQGPKKGKK